jgi:hypothetical protein
MKIKIVQFYYSSDKDYLKHCETINSEYCKKYDIEYYCEKDATKIKQLSDNRNPSWYKIQLLLEHLKSSTCDYVMYMDSDAFVINDSIDIRDILSQYSDYDFICGEDFGPDKINGGVLIFKRTDWSIDFLNRVWDKANLIARGTFKTENWLEQTVLSVFMIVSEPDIKKSVILSHRMPNSINSLHAHSDAFIYHDLSKIRISEYYKIKFENSNDVLSHLNLTTSSDRQVSYHYMDYYVKVINERLSQGPVNILDLGGDNGATFGIVTRLLKDVSYTNITNCDYETKDRIHKIVVNDVTEEMLKLFAQISEKEYDLIIADYKHQCKYRDLIFANLFGKLRSGGSFVIEDLQTDSEINIPHKNEMYGWGDPSKRSMTQNIERFNSEGLFESDYYNFGDISDSIKSAEICRTISGGYYGLIIKK